MFPWTPDRAPAGIAAVRDVSLSKVVREDILGRILRGGLAPGSRINEPDVAERMGVSRVPVREALRELEAMGLVVSRKNVGVFVRELAPREVADLYELRAVLDGHAGTRAAALGDVPRRALSKILDAATARHAQGGAPPRRDRPTMRRTFASTGPSWRRPATTSFPTPTGASCSSCTCGA